MTDDLRPGSFRIVSLSDGANLPIGVNHTRPAGQNIYVNAPVHNWTFEKVGEHRYRLRVGKYRYTGAIEGKVFASLHPEHDEEWDIVRQEYQNAYTIVLANKPHLGWTVPLISAGFPQIELKIVVATPSIPPHFLPKQLFALKESDESD